MEFLDPAGSPANGRQQRLDLLAATLEQAGRQLPESAAKTATEKFLAAAEELYREAAAKSPDHQLALAGYLTRRQRVDEALTIAEKAGDSGAPGAIAGVMTTLLSSANVNPAQRMRCERILLAAAEKHGRPTDLLFVLADFYSMEHARRSGSRVPRSPQEKPGSRRSHEQPGLLAGDFAERSWTKRND